MPSTIADMGNNLLDFVMALVRDQDMAAQYAANPERVIADAHLDGVQPSDVSALIPVVSESMPSISQLAAHPTASDLTHAAQIPADNIWASGAAVSAFDSPFTAPTHDPSLDAGLHAATDAVTDLAPVRTRSPSPISSPHRRIVRWRRSTNSRRRCSPPTVGSSRNSSVPMRV